jgi:hypothetical protein
MQHLFSHSRCIQHLRRLANPHPANETDSAEDETIFILFCQEEDVDTIKLEEKCVKM